MAEYSKATKEHFVDWLKKDESTLVDALLFLNGTFCNESEKSSRIIVLNDLVHGRRYSSQLKPVRDATFISNIQRVTSLIQLDKIKTSKKSEFFGRIAVDYYFDEKHPIEIVHHSHIFLETKVVPMQFVESLIAEKVKIPMDLYINFFLMNRFWEDRLFEKTKKLAKSAEVTPLPNAVMIAFGHEPTKDEFINQEIVLSHEKMAEIAKIAINEVEKKSSQKFGQKRLTPNFKDGKVDKISHYEVSYVEFRKQINEFLPENLRSPTEAKKPISSKDKPLDRRRENSYKIMLYSALKDYKYDLHAGKNDATAIIANRVENTGFKMSVATVKRIMDEIHQFAEEELNPKNKSL